MKAKLTRLGAAAFANTVLIATALAASDTIDGGASDAKGNLSDQSLGGFFGVITNTLIYLVGALAVIMLIIGGLRYVISQGDSTAVKQAKDTILYGIIGLVVAILAYAIVHFVVTSIKTAPPKPAQSQGLTGTAN